MKSKGNGTELRGDRQPCNRTVRKQDVTDSRLDRKGCHNVGLGWPLWKISKMDGQIRQEGLVSTHIVRERKDNRIFVSKMKT